LAICSLSATGSVYVWTSLRPPSLTLTWKVESPACVGVPESSPVEGFRDRPAGSEPEFTDHDRLLPPVAVSCRLYAVLVWPAGSVLWRWAIWSPCTMVMTNWRSDVSASLHQTTPPSHAGMSLILIQNS